MAQEWAMVTVGVLASISTLAGAGLNWLLSNVSAESAARRVERSDQRKALEERYLSVQLSLERFVRSPMDNDELDDEFSRLNSIMVLFASDDVRSAFRVVVDKFDAYEKAFKDSDKTYHWVSSASVDYPEEWKSFLTAGKELSSCMRKHIALMSNA